MQHLEVSGAVRPIYASLGFKGIKQSSGTDRFRYVCKFQCSYKTDKPVAGPAPGLSSSSLACKFAGPAACGNTHLFTSHPAPDSDPAPGLPVCVQASLILPEGHATRLR